MPADADGWMRSVLGAQPTPAWLAVDAPQADVVLSSRVRIMRNLVGYRFPTKASDPELEEVRAKVALASGKLNMTSLRILGPAEREYLIGCRLISPDFPASLSTRMVLLDQDRSVGVMVNEEDHLRIQGVTAGLSIANATGLAENALRGLSSLEFAHTDRLGYLAASPFNAGKGTRHSCMMHLIGLAHARRLPAVMKALAAYRVAARGLFGESSRAIGALVQVSVTNGSTVEFAGACEYLIREERLARRTIGREGLIERAKGVRDFAVTSRSLTLADGLRILAWSRWAQYEELDGFRFEGRHLDGLLTTLEVRGGTGDKAGHRRAEHFRELFGG